MGLTLTVLGCCGSYPGPGEACSGYLVESGETTVWLDAGSGTMANLQRHVGLGDVDAVVLSHLHPDHWSDIEGFHVACRYGDAPREGVPIYAPAALPEKTSTDMAPTFEWHTITDGTSVDIGDMHFTFSRTDHGPETLAARIEAGGRVLGYSADTGPGWALSALGPGIDLALCEATFLQHDEGRSQHMSGRQAGASARGAGVRRLLLTHVWPTTDREAVRAEGSAAFGAPVEMASTNERYEV